MPRRPSIHNAISPRTSSNAVNDVIGALSRKLTQSHVEVTKISPPQSRRGSLKMEQLLHPGKKEKKRSENRSESIERNGSKEKRGSLTGALGLSSKNKHSDALANTSPRLKSAVGGSLKMDIESPPIVLIGSPSYSTGAIISGRVKLNIDDPAGELTLNDMEMVLRRTTTTKKPVQKECQECCKKQETLKEWKFLSEPHTYKKNDGNDFPWSCMLDGKTPATNVNQLGSISYAIVVKATTSFGETLELKHALDIRRAIPPGQDKASIRIFPPTNLTGRVTMCPVVHPIGKFPVSLTLSGVVEKKQASQTRWRLKKMMWRVEEHSKIKSVPCQKHKNKVTEGKAVLHTEFKTLGNDDIKTGWKTDFDTAGGEISLDFEASLATKAAHKVACDIGNVDSALEVKHNLVIELIVAEEFVPNKNTNLITPTGAARVLRMQFALTVTERAGMGLSWDDEQPPMYEDVPPSPPGYGKKQESFLEAASIEDYSGPALEYTDLERVQTTNPQDPPTYRERDFAEVNSGLPMRYQVDSDEAGPSALSRRMGGFSLDELEAAPQFRRRPSDEDANQEPDFAEGESGAAANDTNQQ